MASWLHLSFPSVCCNWYTLPTDSVRAHFNNFLLLRDHCSAPSTVWYLQTLISYIQSNIFFSLILDNGVSQVPITPSWLEIQDLHGVSQYPQIQRTLIIPMSWKELSFTWNHPITHFLSHTIPLLYVPVISLAFSFSSLSVLCISVCLWLYIIQLILIVFLTPLT